MGLASLGVGGIPNNNPAIQNRRADSSVVISSAAKITHKEDDGAEFKNK
jgi:hypothetical protein